MKHKGLQRSGITEISFWTPDATANFRGPITLCGLVAEVAADLIDAGEEGVTLDGHDSWFTSTVMHLSAYGLEVEVHSGPVPWILNAAGARFVLKTSVSGVQRKHGDQITWSPYVPGRRPDPPTRPWHPFRRR